MTICETYQTTLPYCEKNNDTHKEKCACFCDDRSKIVVQGKGKESGKKLIINNLSKNTFCVRQLDACVLVQEASCDYVVINCTKNEIILLELKGSDVNKAIEQLLQTINKLKDKPFFKLSEKIIICSIHSHVPNPRLWTTNNLKLNRLLANLHTKQTNYTPASREHTITY
jgi:hypothetical protein